jgi:hypothetical protein
MKLKTEALPLSLGPSELKSVFSLVHGALGSYPMDVLKTQPGDYLILSCLDNFYDKLFEKSRRVRQYGIKKVTITLKRHEAIALLHLLESERSADDEPFIPALAEASYEAAVVSELTAAIKQVFFS